MQTGQMALFFNERQQGTLPSTLEVNPKCGSVEYYKAITLRSGRKLEEPREAKEENMELYQPSKPEMKQKLVEEEKNSKSKAFSYSSPPYLTKVPLPQRLWKKQGRNSSQNEERGKKNNKEI